MERLAGIVILVVAIVAAVPYLDRMTDPAGATAQEDARRPRQVNLQAGRGGHFELVATVNGRTVHMLADTGATAVVLNRDDARRSGFDHRALDFRVPVNTANGTTHMAPVMLESVEVEGIVVNDVRALVAGPGDLATSLLGLSYLNKLASVTMTGNTLELVE